MSFVVVVDEEAKMVGVPTAVAVATIGGAVALEGVTTVLGVL
jgi:hypothetical protein